MSELIANYSLTGTWDLEELGVDLKVVHDWWGKWDTLYVQKEENGEIEEYEGSVHYDANEYLKRPVDMYLDGEMVGQMSSVCIYETNRPTLDSTKQGTKRYV